MVADSRLHLAACAVCAAAQGVLRVDAKRVHLRAQVIARGVRDAHAVAVLAVRVGDWTTGGRAVVENHDTRAAAEAAITACVERLHLRAVWLRAQLAATEAAMGALVATKGGES